ncbi:Alpha,alpha-trehalose-phosphate synthase (UDP-forming) [Bertholletia excelsa]
MQYCSSFSDLTSGNLWNLSDNPSNLQRVNSSLRILFDQKGDRNNNKGSDDSASVSKKIIVSNFLPIHAEKDSETGIWLFNFDEDSILLQLRDGFTPGTEVYHVGSLKVDIDVEQQEEVADKLLNEFNCVPTFLSSDLQNKFYQGFCKQYLWPIFHYMLPLCPDFGIQFDRKLWKAYVSANKVFADKVCEVINPIEDHIWIHDYHLMILPSFLRRRYNRVKAGFFLHSPFPSAEIYRTLPVRDEILKALLNADLVGFQTYDYARHFLSCCSRILGLEYEAKWGYLGVEYFGRTIYIKILPVGIHMGWLKSALSLHASSLRVKEIQKEFKGKKLILGIDDMDIFKGVSLKLQALEELLKQHRNWVGKLVLVQIVNPARSTGVDARETMREIKAITTRINKRYGFEGYDPIVLIDHALPIHEKIAYYALADCCVVNAVRDGLNLIPYTYVVCRQGSPVLDDAMGVAPDSSRTSALVISEFLGCSPSLSGAIRVNPWDIQAVAEALYRAITMSDSEMQLRHEKHFRYVSSHDVAYWARSFEQDLEWACKDHYVRKCWGLGLGMNFRVLSLSPYFRKLYFATAISAYKSSKRRAIFLDYDGTLLSPRSVDKSPNTEVMTVLDILCSCPKNTVFIVSGRGHNCLGKWFSGCEKLGIAAEHGYFLRWNGNSAWESYTVIPNFDWKRLVEPIMRLYTESTDGSYIEDKVSALVWHHQDADPSFGSLQAKELLDHLEVVLANEPVVVKRGQNIVEVKPQGVSKGLAAEKVLRRMVCNGEWPDFVMCIGDDRSDEDMFESILGPACCTCMSEDANIFTCTVGQKPSKAMYYLDDIGEVLSFLRCLAEAAQVEE